MSDELHTEAQSQILDEASTEDYWLDALRDDPALAGAAAKMLAAMLKDKEPDYDELAIAVSREQGRVIYESTIARARELDEMARDRADEYRVERWR